MNGKLTLILEVDGMEYGRWSDGFEIPYGGGVVNPTLETRLTELRGWVLGSLATRELGSWREAKDADAA